MSREITLRDSVIRHLSKVAFSCPAQSEVAVAGDTQQAGFHDAIIHLR